MNRGTQVLLPIFSLLLLGACDAGDQALEESSEYDDATESESESGDFDSDGVENVDDSEMPWNDDGDLASDPDAQGRVFPADWDLDMNYAGGVNGQQNANIFWEVNGPLPRDYTLCWKNVDSPGTVCGGGVEVTHTATSGNTGADNFTARVVPLVCGETYKVRVKRGWSQDTEELTFDCPCADPCPDGGWYDEANCQIGQAPLDTTAFVWGTGYYHTPLPGNSCPLPGSYYDGANCRVSTIPSGVDPFISNNHWYYGRVCTP